MSCESLSTLLIIRAKANYVAKSFEPMGAVGWTHNEGSGSDRDVYSHVGASFCLVELPDCAGPLLGTPQQKIKRVSTYAKAVYLSENEPGPFTTSSTDCSLTEKATTSYEVGPPVVV